MSSYQLSMCCIGTVTELYSLFDNQVIGSGLRQLKHLQRPWVLNQIINFFGNQIREKKILEIGAGFDYSASNLSTKFGADVYNLDKYENEWNSRSGKTFQDCVNENPHVKYIFGLAGYPIEHKIADTTFDCIFSTSVLEHAPKDHIDAVLEDIDRMLKINGIQVHAIDFLVDRGDDQLMSYLNYFKKYLIEADHTKLDGMNLGTIRSNPDTFYETPEIVKLYWTPGRKDVKFLRCASLNLMIIKKS